MILNCIRFLWNYRIWFLSYSFNHNFCSNPCWNWSFLMENITTVLLSQHFIFWYCIFLYKLSKLRLYLSLLEIEWWICFFLLLKFNVFRTLFLYDNWKVWKNILIFIEKTSISNRSGFIKRIFNSFRII